MNQNLHDLTQKTSPSVETIRLEYCLSVFERQQETIGELEKKTQLLLSFLTAILGALFIKFDYLKTIAIDLTSNKLPFFVSLFGWLSLAMVAFSSIISLIYLLNSIRLRTF
jgi:hypothetical protein